MSGPFSPLELKSLQGKIEEHLGDARLVEQGLERVALLESNAPSVKSPDRRRFIRVAAGAVAASLLHSGCVTTGGSTGGGRSSTYNRGGLHSAWTTDWREFLLGEDPIRGPRLLIAPYNNRPNDFENHQRNPINDGPGSYGVDWIGVRGTPIVPAADGGRLEHFNHESYGGHNVVVIVNDKYRILNAHTSGGMTKIFSADKLTVIEIMDNSGGRDLHPHNHFAVHDFNNQFDPFTLGIDGGGLNFEGQWIEAYDGKEAYVPQHFPQRGLPTYWDGETELRHVLTRRTLPKWHQKVMDNLDTTIAKVKEEDPQAHQELWHMRGNARKLRDYLGYKVLTPKQDEEGNKRYEFLPGSAMYSLMLQVFNATTAQKDITLTLPFISPLVIDKYRPHNPAIAL